MATKGRPLCSPGGKRVKTTSLPQNSRECREWECISNARSIFISKLHKR